MVWSVLLYPVNITFKTRFKVFVHSCQSNQPKPTSGKRISQGIPKKFCSFLYLEHSILENFRVSCSERVVALLNFHDVPSTEPKEINKKSQWSYKKSIFLGKSRARALRFSQKLVTAHTYPILESLVCILKNA